MHPERKLAYQSMTLITAAKDLEISGLIILIIGPSFQSRSWYTPALYSGISL